jgi:transposase InsO family protein
MAHSDESVEPLHIRSPEAPTPLTQDPVQLEAPSVQREGRQPQPLLHPSLSSLTALLQNDTTRPSSANIKVAQTLMKNGYNYRVWMYALLTAAISKDCVEALQSPLPSTRANAAAMMLITDSVPEEWAVACTLQPSAFDALTALLRKFQGGYEKSINREWARQLEKEVMTREETLESLVTKKTVLYENLLANSHSLDPEDLSNAIVDCLPPEMHECKPPLYGALYEQTPAQMIKLLRLHAYGVKFNDQIPRPLPRAAPAITKVPNEESSRPRKMRCWECGSFDHMRRDCKKWEKMDKGSADSTNCKSPPSVQVPVPCPTNVLPLPVTLPVVSFNVLQLGGGGKECEEWLVDSGATVHLVNDMNILQNPTVYSEPRTLQLATSEASGQIVASGSVCILNSEGHTLWIHNVQCVPMASTNLLSVSAGIRDGITFVPRENGAYHSMIGPMGWECRIVERYGLYVLTGVFPTSKLVVCQVCIPSVSRRESTHPKHDCRMRRMWHERLGHPGKTATERLNREGMVTGIPVSLLPCVNCDTHCDPCVRGKQCKPSFNPSDSKQPKVLHRVHADTVGTLPTAGLGGERYFLTVVEEHSNYCAVSPVGLKTNIPHKLIDTITKWERQVDSKIKVVRTDRGTEFLNKTFQGYCAENGIHTEMSAVYTPQQNGVAERMNRTLKEKARTLLLGVEADESLWVEAICTAAYLHNMTPGSGRDKTPHELLYGTKPDLSHLRKWGCLAYVKHAKHQVSTIGAQSEAGMFVGYCPHTKGYKVRLPGRVVVSPSVHFVENKSGASAVGLTVRPESAGQPCDTSCSPVQISTPADTCPSRVLDLGGEDSTMTEDHLETMPSHNGTSPSAMEEDEETTNPSQTTSPSLTLLDDDAGAPGVAETTEVGPTVDGVHERMLRSARTTNEVPSTSNGARARARSIIRHMAGHPIKLKPAREKGAAKKLGRLPAIEESREVRLRNRNARKEEIILKLAESETGHQKNCLNELSDSIEETGDGMAEKDGEPDENSEDSRSNVVETCELEMMQREEVGTGEEQGEAVAMLGMISHARSESAQEDKLRLTEVQVDTNNVHMESNSHVEGNKGMSARRVVSQGKPRQKVTFKEQGSNNLSCDKQSGWQPKVSLKGAQAQHSEYQGTHSELRSAKTERNSDNMSCDKQSGWQPKVSLKGAQAQHSEYQATYSELRSAKTVRDFMHMEDGAESSGDVFHDCIDTDEREQVDSEPASIAFLRACLASPAGVRFSKVHVPDNYREARMSDQWEFWEQAMNEEKNSLDAHDCFEYVDRPKGKKVIPVHWIYSIKVDEHGNVIRYKARLVAQGCRQVQGIDVDEVFAPTSSFGARRVLLSKAAHEDMEIHQVDIKTAFLNGELEEEVYVSQPPGFHNGGAQVCRLNKALYGLKQAPRAWYQKLDATLEKHGFQACMSDAGIYVSEKSGEAPVYLVLFVDDMLIMSMDIARVRDFKKAISDEFSIHDLGEVKDFLGCQIVRDRAQKKIWMSSGLKIEALVESFGLDGETRGVETPMSKSFVPTSQSSQDSVEGAGIVLEPGHRYCELVGSLLYLANTTRPDIAQAVGVLSRYRGAPTTAHMQEGLRVVRYLKGTQGMALRLGGNDCPLEGYVDADYAGDLDARASTTGFVFQVYGGAVVWGSKKQSATANSTVEAEFRAASHAVKEATWLRGLLEELHVPVWKTPLYCDNTGCIQNLKNPVNSKYTKHVAVSFHHARSAVIQGEVDVKYVSTQLNVADIFTKPLVPILFKQHRKSLGVGTRLDY